MLDNTQNIEKTVQECGKVDVNVRKIICSTCNKIKPTQEEKDNNRFKEGRFCVKCGAYLGEIVTIYEKW